MISTCDRRTYFYFFLQLRECLESDVFELFHKKLTEHALMKDPKFLWCCHVSSLTFLFFKLLFLEGF